MKTSRCLNPFFFGVIGMFITGIAMAPATVSAGGPITQDFAASPFATSLRDGGRLIVRRTPTLGNDVFVNLTIDGVPLRGIGYGQSYEGFLRPGPHIVSAIIMPRPTDKEPWTMTLNVRSGMTYGFTAAPFAGRLVLQPNRR